MAKASPSVYWTLRLANERLALRLPRQPLLALVGMCLALLALLALSLMLGSYSMSPAEVWQVLNGLHADSDRAIVVWEFRFPRTLVAALVGAMLAMSGAALQNVTRNGLADPALVGISQGAGLAVVSLTIVWPQLPGSWYPWAAFCGSLIVAALIQALSWNRQGGSSIRFILMGIGMAAFITAITSALLTYGDVQRALSALAWLSGSLHTAGWPDVQMLSLWLVLLVPLALGLSRAMAALQMGEDTAIGLGVSARRVRYALISVAVALAAIATAVVGPLGFVGLIAPHAARRLARAGVGLHLLLTALLGALLVMLADLLGRALFAPIQIPAGLVTAIIGVPFFVVLLHRAQAKSTF